MDTLIGMKANPLKANKTIANSNDAQRIIEDIGMQAKTASRVLLRANKSVISQTLKDLASIILEQADAIQKANELDVEQGTKKDLPPALIDRLTLTPERIQSMADGVLAIEKLEAPTGNILEEWARPNGLIIQKMAVPIGVLGMIYESRPNVTIDASALCLKSQNAVILRGGSESFNSSTLLHKLIQQALEKNGLDKNIITMMPSTDRALVGAMLGASDYIDVMIPRGGQGLTRRVMAEAQMPVFAHLDGNCHIYVDDSANIDLVVEVIVNAKLRRTGICGAVESLLFDATIDDSKAKAIITALLDKDCAVVGDDKAQSIDSRVSSANDSDWKTEYLDAKISCKYVDGVDEAINHINTYGSHHTDCIISENLESVQQFQMRVDSAIVMHNASTQFADGGEFGMGAEIGIGTGKLHARGPVGVKQLTTFKYIVKGTGQTRP